MKGILKRFFVFILPALWLPCYFTLILISPAYWIATGKDKLFNLAEKLDGKVDKYYWDNI